jgi:arylsulfatase A-like enzyme
MFRSVSKGALIGAIAAAALALGDFGASWLWINEALDRLELFVRLLAIEVPVGAALGALLGAFAHAVEGPMRRLVEKRAAGNEEARARIARRLWPVPFVLLASPALAAIAWMLFTGGSASRLPMRPLLVLCAALVLASGAYVALRIGRWLYQRAVRDRLASYAVAALAVVLQVGVTKVDQVVLPGLYEYLHALLAACAWMLAAFTVLVLSLHSKLAARADARLPAVGLGTLGVLFAIWLGAVWTLGMNQTVRVALLSPRASASRSLMLGIGPVLSLGESRAAAEAVDRARRARAARRNGRTADGPMIDGAHVFLITIDALRADHLGLYGYRTRPVSPWLDRFARESVVFEMAYAQAPHSSYSISSLMTSEYLFQRTDLGLPLPEETLASTLRESGYHTSAYYIEGIFHTDGERMAQYKESAFGFGQRSHENAGAEQKTDQLLVEVDRILEAGEPPTLLWGHYFDVHEPYMSTRYGTHDIERYDGEIREVDGALERFVREAQARLERPVIFVITADHGEEFHDHGGVYHGSTVYQEQIRVPFIVHAPGIEPRRVETPVEIVDIAPTVLGLVGVPAPPSMRGDDLRPLMTGAAADFGPVFASAGYKHMVVRWPHKLIADLRFGTYELFDLAADRAERRNLANERPELVEELRGELRAWLDSLADEELSPYEIALHRGRLADRSAVPDLGTLLNDETAEVAMRVEAAQHLAALPERTGKEALVTALSSREPLVADEAAISLAHLGDARAPRARLRRLLEEEDDDARRARTAIALARVHDQAAAPVLIEIFSSDDREREQRQEAIRLAGVLRDREAVEPLLDLLEDERLRRVAALSLGRIGDPRAYEPIIELLEEARHSTIRESSARALGYLGDRRAVPHIVAQIPIESLPSAAESLVRLDGIGHAIGGADFAPGVRARGVTGCRELPTTDLDNGFLERTTCENTAPRVELSIRVPDSVRSSERVLVILRTRRLDGGLATSGTLRLGERVLDAPTIDGGWTEHRWTIAGSELTNEAVIEIADATARVALDHILAIPIAPPPAD